QHLDAAKGELASLEDRAAAGDQREAAELAARFRSGQLEALVLEASAPSNLDQARRAVEVAQQAFDQLTAEAEATHRELVIAQQRVGFCIRDVLRAELLAMARLVAEHDRVAEGLRANLQQAGFVTANLQRRHNWHGRIFTTTMTAA